jgi:hypothetical protein
MPLTHRPLADMKCLDETIAISVGKSPQERARKIAKTN